MSTPPSPQKGYYVDPRVYAASDTARNTGRAAEASAEMSERLGELVVAMDEQLRVARQAQADAERSERFTRWMAVISLVVAVASLGAAIAAVVLGV